MKNIIILVLLLNPFFLISKNIPERQAEKVAEKWMKKKYDKTDEVSEIHLVKYNDSVSFYIFNFSVGGFVMVPADDRINPILGYAPTGMLKPDPDSTEPIYSVFKLYNERIDFVKKNKTDKQNNKTKKKWDNILSDSIQENGTKSVTLDVPSLFETYQTSRWATWSGYNTLLPDQNGTNICVPLAMSQICKFHKHPKQGVGSNSYISSHDGTTNFSINYADHLFNYDLMPFRLTYCGNGGENCNEGSFNFLPGITEENKEEISHLIYSIGLGVDQPWFGSANYLWLDDWATVMEENLGYKSTWTYWNTTSISNAPETFKSSMRNNLEDKLPILLRIVGHLLVIDGFEDLDYFHTAFGRGGYDDGYYYLFTADADGFHLLIPGSSDLDAILDLEPDYSFPENETESNNISSTTTKCYQAFNTVTISSVIDGNGTTGANIAIYSKEIILGAGFEIKKGATLYMKSETY